MSALSNQFLPEAFHEATSECLWTQTVSILAIVVANYKLCCTVSYAPALISRGALKSH